MPRVCITVPGKNSQPYRFSLDRKIVRLGRAADNDIIIDCPSVSSHHCEMRRVEGGYILQDLDSTNGIKADGCRMEVLDLENDVDVSIGDADLDFELTDDERADLKKEPHKSHGKVKLPPISKDNDSDDDRSNDDEDKPRPKKQKKRVAPAPAPPASRTPGAPPPRQRPTKRRHQLRHQHGLPPPRRHGLLLRHVRPSQRQVRPQPLGRPLRQPSPRRKKLGDRVTTTQYPPSPAPRREPGIDTKSTPAAPSVPAHAACRSRSRSPRQTRTLPRR